MSLFKKPRERNFEEELNAAQSVDTGTQFDTDAAEPTAAFSDDEYEAIFDPLTLEDLQQKSAAELAGLAALTLAAVEDDVRIFDEYGRYDAEIAADYARASALGNLALLKHAGVPFDTRAIRTLLPE